MHSATTLPEGWPQHAFLFPPASANRMHTPWAVQGPCQGLQAGLRAGCRQPYKQQQMHRVRKHSARTGGVVKRGAFCAGRGGRCARSCALVRACRMHTLYTPCLPPPGDREASNRQTRSQTSPVLKEGGGAQGDDMCCVHVATFAYFNRPRAYLGVLLLLLLNLLGVHVWLLLC